MKKILSVLLVCLLIATMSLSMAAAENYAIYRGVAAGYRGDMTVHVEIADGKLTSVHAVSHGDTKTLVEDVLDQLGETMVEHQTVNVDVVSGATFSSMGFINGARAALEAAGQLDAFNAKVPQVVIEREDETVDVVVVGAGGSGLMSALTLALEDFGKETTDIKVLVLEKQGVVGGSTRLATGSVIASEGSVANEVAGVTTSTADMITMLETTAGMELNHPYIEKLFSQSGDTLDKLSNLGAAYAIGGAPRVRTGAGIKYITVGGADWHYNYDRKGNQINPYNAGGNMLATFLESKVRGAGVEIRLNSPATELIVENGAVVGVKVEADGSSYNVYAKNVILAAGAMSQNPAVMAKYNPEIVGSMPYLGGGADGDGYVMAEAVDAVRVGRGSISYLGVDFRYGIHGIPGTLYNAIKNVGNIHVNQNGERFVYVSGMSDSKVCELVLKQPGYVAYAVLDSNNTDAATVEAWLEKGYGYKADTIEGLAEACGMDAATLKATVNTYNNVIDTQGEDAFGRPLEKMTKIEQGPFYAFQFHAISIGSLMGLKVNENCQIINADGNVVPGLYAVGDMSLGGNGLSGYYLGGVGLCNAIGSGRIAGEHIKAGL